MDRSCLQLGEYLAALICCGAATASYVEKQLSSLYPETVAPALVPSLTSTIITHVRVHLANIAAGTPLQAALLSLDPDPCKVDHSHAQSRQCLLRAPEAACLRLMTTDALLHCRLDQRSCSPDAAAPGIDKLHLKVWTICKDPAWHRAGRELCKVPVWREQWTQDDRDALVECIPSLSQRREQPHEGRQVGWKCYAGQGSGNKAAAQASLTSQVIWAVHARWSCSISRESHKSARCCSLAAAYGNGLNGPRSKPGWMCQPASVVYTRVTSLGPESCYHSQTAHR